MTDSWTDSNGDNVPSDWTPGGPLTPGDEWGSGCGCAPPDAPSIAKGVVITGRPATITAMPWQITLNDGGTPANFTIDHYDAAGVLIDNPLSFSGVDGSASFENSVYLAADPVAPLEAATKQYVDNTPAGIEEAPDNQTYGRTLGAWNLVVPASGGTFTGQTNLSAGGAVTGGALLFVGSAVLSLPTVAQLQIGGGSFGQVPATDGAGNLSWVTPVVGGPYLPISGGTITGSLTVNQILTVQGANSMVLNAAMGNQRAILSQTSGLTRWQLQLGDTTAEGLNNVGSNFALTAYGGTGSLIGNWLTIARADGSTMLNGPVNMNAGAAVNGLFSLQGAGSFNLPGGSAGQFLSTNGTGVLSWATPAGGGGGISDAPNDGTLYGRKSAAWAHLTHTDITDWTATLAPYALTTAIPLASSTLPLPSGVAAVGTSAAYARADHVHPSDGYPHDNRIINGDMRIDQRNNGASGTTQGVYTVDRWNFVNTTAPTGRGAWQRQTSGAPALTATGFGYFLSFVSSSAYVSAAGDQFNFYQPIEADMIADFQWGTANAQPVTLSFWAQSSLTGTFSGAIRNQPSPATRTYPFTFAISSAGVWQKFTITIPGDTGGAWVLQGNAAGLQLTFDLGSGATFRAPANAWAAGSYIGATGAVSVVAVNGATFFVTGVKLEIGSVATPFNRQSLAKSWADCQRYYQAILGLQALNYAGAAGANGTTMVVTSPMRATPTATPSNQAYNANTNSLFCSPTSVQVIQTSATAVAAGNIRCNFDLALNAEL